MFYFVQNGNNNTKFLKMNESKLEKNKHILSFFLKSGHSLNVKFQKMCVTF